MSYFGKNSYMCIHGCEDGKCEQCYDDFMERGVRHEPLGTFGEMEAKRKAEQEPEKVSIGEQVRREVVAEFMARSEARHRND